MSAAPSDPLERWWHALARRFPAPVAIDRKERWRLVVGVVLGVLVTAWVSRWIGLALGHSLWMVATVGASAVLVFGLPSSPMAQPWPVWGGSLLSALVGGLCAWAIPDTALAAAAAVGLAVVCMIVLRCLHPPGGAMALYAVLTHAQGAALAVFPVMVNVTVLLLLGAAYNRATGRIYPASLSGRRPAAPADAAQFAREDIDQALADFNGVLDISRADLERLLHHAGQAAFRRTLGTLRCADFMSHPPLAVEASLSLREAWALMRKHEIKALPVVDAQAQVEGIVTVADFMRQAYADSPEGLGQRLKALVLGRSGVASQTVGQIMSSPVQVADERQHAMELVPLFSHGGHHHLPVVDDQGRLVGVITQTDLVRVLASAVRPAEASAG